MKKLIFLHTPRERAPPNTQAGEKKKGKDEGTKDRKTKSNQNQNQNKLEAMHKATSLPTTRPASWQVIFDQNRISKTLAPPAIKSDQTDSKDPKRVRSRTENASSSNVASLLDE
jgi:hypothetical protein